jgi:phosphatidylserine/phosphatidylglycerophosphate/cardiolipin synthase-like enzyme
LDKPRDKPQDGIMHHKYVVIDDFCVLTGSFNWTHNAVTTNEEDVLIVHCKATAAKYK